MVINSSLCLMNLLHLFVFDSSFFLNRMLIDFHVIVFLLSLFDVELQFWIINVDF